MSVFPITLAAHEAPHFTQSAYRYRQTMRAALLAADPKATYYAYDTILHSRIEAEFIVYDMRDNIHGGIGKETHRVRATIAPELSAEDVERAIYRAAMMRRAQELADEEDRIVASYVDDIRLEYPMPVVA